MSPEQPSSKIGKSVGEKLRAARVAQHYTQSQLAAPDFSVSYISAIERGQIHPSLRALEILAARLGLSSTQLLPNRSQIDDRLSSLHITERDEDEAELILLEAENLIRQDAMTQAVTLLEKFSTKRLKRQQQLQHRYLLGWAYYKTERFQECEYILSEAAQTAKELNANYLSLRILNILALAYAAMRNYPQAILTHQRCINQIETTEPHDPFLTAQIYMYMGQHYTHLDNTRQALEMFNKALTITAELATVENAQRVYSDMIERFAETKEYDLATIYGYKGIYLSEQKVQKTLKSQLYHYLGRAILKGEPEVVQTFLDEASQREALADQLTRASIAARCAQWHHEQRALGEAEAYAQQAWDMAKPFGDTIIGADTLITLGRVEYTRGNRDEGDEHYNAGLDMLERLGQHEELADESVHYAELLEEAGKDREAFTHFRRAFQSRQKLGK